MNTHKVLGLFLAGLLLASEGAEAGEFWSNPFSNDADSGISSGNVYTHAANIRGSDVSINGVLFVSGDASGTGWTLGGTSNAYDNSGAGLLSGNVTQLIDDFRYGPGNGQANLTLTGLTPGQSYVTTWYNKSWGAAGTRVVGVSASDGGGVVFDENFTGGSTGNQLHYGYVAPDSGSITFTFANGADTYHHYAFSNEEAAPGSYALPFSAVAMTGDADSGIAANKLYTHAVDTAGTNTSGWRSVNDVQFERAAPPTGGNTSGTQWSVSGANSGLANSPGNVTGDVGVLVGDFWYNGNPQVVTLTGLEPGQQYQAVWYGRAYGTAGTRVQTITTDDGAGGSTIDSFGFDENFTGDGNGNRLVYNYTAPASGKLRITFTPEAAGTFHQHAFTNELLPSANLLLADSFNSSVNQYPISSANPTAGNRQSGTLGTVGWAANGNAQIGNGGFDQTDVAARHPGVLLEAGGGWAGLIHNFNEAESDGGLSIHFDLDPQWAGYNADLSNWGAVSLGASRFASGAVNRGDEHFGILFRGNGDYQVFDGSTAVASGALGLGALNGTLTHFEIRLTDPGDGNPFDGVGQTNVDVYADGGSSPVYSYVKTGGGYSNNFINLQGASYTQFDNLRIESLDGPYTPPVSPFTSDTMTGDLDSGIQAGGAYTHAINLNHTGNTTVNGAVFTGSGADVDNPGTNNYSTGNLANNYSGNANPVTGQANALLNEFLYSDNNPETLTLNNLRPGEQYVATFYNTAFGGTGGRPIHITTSQGDQIAFDENFTNDRNGNVLRYEFTAQDTSMTFTFTPLKDGASMHQYAFTNELANYNALLTDNYYAPSNPDTYNVNYNLEARQGGRLADGSATVSYTRSGNQQVGNATGGVDGGNYLLSAFGGTTALDHNFNGDAAHGGLLISFDMAPNLGNSSDTSVWGAISLGLSEADRNAAINSGAEHFGILFRSNGLIQAFDGSTDVTGGTIAWTDTGLPVTTELHHFELLLSDPTDSNPLDGVGQTNIDVFADGLSIYSFVKTGGGYTDNFINFSANAIGAFDNLLIAQAVPEPSALVMLLGLAGVGAWTCIRRRRRG